MKTSVMFYQMRLLAVVILLLMPMFVFSQSRKLVVKEEKDRYIEGVYALEVGASLDIISFFDYFEAYETGKRQQLQAAFTSPGIDSFMLKAEEKKIVGYYWMESKPATTKKGLNVFGPWLVDGLLRRLAVPASNLGVLLRYGAQKRNYLLPLSVYQGTSPKSSDQYKAVFRLAKSISRGQFKVYKGEYSGVPPEAKLAQTGMIGKNLGGSVFQIAIDKADLKGYTGWVTVNLLLEERNTTNKTPFRFYFYHSNPQ